MTARRLPWCATAFACLLVLCAAPATAWAREQARIDAERSEAERELWVQERECAGAWAENACAEAARARYRDRMADLRRQELALSEDGRRQRLQTRAVERERRAAAAAALREQREAAPQSSRTPKAAGVADDPRRVRDAGSGPGSTTHPHAGPEREQRRAAVLRSREADAAARAEVLRAREAQRQARRAQRNSGGGDAGASPSR